MAHLSTYLEEVVPMHIPVNECGVSGQDGLLRRIDAREKPLYIISLRSSHVALPAFLLSVPQANM